MLRTTNQFQKQPSKSFRRRFVSWHTRVTRADPRCFKTSVICGVKSHSAKFNLPSGVKSAKSRNNQHFKTKFDNTCFKNRHAQFRNVNAKKTWDISHWVPQNIVKCWWPYNYLKVPFWDHYLRAWWVNSNMIALKLWNLIRSNKTSCKLWRIKRATDPFVLSY